ncbi:uncharacterized protein LOC132698667 [Cylas formicarius]|uniref:uncharacterized protein LOC132698667 n=1 Tax=Cylas formicarius TaxID=197179 RepID=UPI002958B0BA|nr:uncharacterized protein LOC132698667 [Cylas formicarius]
MAPKLYYMAVSPPCRAVIMVAKAIGLELDLETVESKDQLKTPEMLEINPQHTVPILVDADEDFTVWDSHAISGYLVGQYAEDDSMYPKNDVKKRALIDQRLHFENGVLFERCKTAFLPLFMGESQVSEDDADKLIEAFGFLEEFLGDNQWMVGDDITIADLSLLATVATVELFFPIDAERFPKMTEWLARGKELPYFDEVNSEGFDAFKGFMPNVDGYYEEFCVAMPIVLYGTILSPPVRAVLMTANALGLSLDFREIDLIKGDHLKPEYQKINPQHTVPTLDDDGVILWDSHAIVAYLVGKYAKDDSLYPRDLAKRALIDARLHFDTGYAFAAIRTPVRAVLFHGQTGGLTDLQKQAILEVYDFLNKFLENRIWLVGNSVTIADISLLSTVTSLAAILPVDATQFSNVSKWLKGAEDLPFFNVNKPGLESFSAFVKQIF